MVKEIVKDVNVLTQKSEKVELNEAVEIVVDLLDTANQHVDHCVGLAAPQIGVLKKVIVVRTGNAFYPMINPVILKKIGNQFNSVEGCLSLEGERTVKRHQSVMVNYQDVSGKKLTKTFTGFIATIIQHEVDHLNGKLI
jgi:peptide deformylase